MECSNCGTKLSDSAKFCANCGAKVELSESNSQPAENLSEPENSQAVNVNEQPVQNVNNNYQSYYPPQNGIPPGYGAVYVGSPPNKSKKNIIKIIIPIVTVLFTVFVILIVLGVALIPSLFKSGPDFKKLYDRYCDSTWADVGSDGSYLSIDTNPYDIDDSGIAYYAAEVAIEEINSELGLPDSLLEDMGKTSALMGKQSETFSDIGVTVSWTYHPDKGLEITYKLAN